MEDQLEPRAAAIDYFISYYLFLIIYFILQ